MRTLVQYGVRVRPLPNQPGWVLASLRKTWLNVGQRATEGRTVAETAFERGSMTEDEMVITALLELARAMKDELA